MREAAETADSTTIRLSVNLTPEIAESLRSISNRRGITLTEAIRRAISTQLFVEDALDQGAKILISEPDEPVRELVFMR
jgi:predicted transcriptional regulator